MKDDPAYRSGGHLLHNLVLFGRALRAAGLDINPDLQIAMVSSLSHVDIGCKDEFYHALRCLVVNGKQEIAIFDKVFIQFWLKPGQHGILFQFPGGKIPSPPLAENRDGNHPGRRATLGRSGGNAAEPDQASRDELPSVQFAQTYSAKETLRHKDFAELNPDELVKVKERISELIWQLGYRRSRRFKPGRGNQIDIRRSYRRNLQNGGEILQWRYREPTIRPRPLVVIADISGSMERYSRLLIHFVYSLATTLEQPVESFVFSTRLTRITYPLRSKNFERVTKELSNTIPDWSGGTRIGEALKRFNHDWARRVLGHGAVTLIISDGWDRGDPLLLSNEMARLQRSSHRLIWLNPLLGSPDYEPLTRGMIAALPFIDDFLPVHNLASLEQLARRLSDVGAYRKTRYRQARFSS